MTDVTIIILSYNTKELLLNCLKSVFETIKELSFEVVVVDNNSHDGSPKAVLKAFPDVRVIENSENLGFAKANNIVLRETKSPYALLLNSDTILTQGAVKAICDFMEEKDDAGICAGQLLNEDGTKQNSFAYFPGIFTLLFNESLINTISPFRKNKHSITNTEVKVDSCIGACILMKMEAVRKAGFFDESFFFFFEETDLALTMHQNGWSSYIVPKAKIYHLGGQSVGHSIKSRLLFSQSRRIYYKKHFPLLSCVYMPLIMVRLTADLLINLTVWTLTLFFATGKKNKVMLYYELLIWHMKGCPAVQ